jgi:hypothetical protein
VTTVHDAVKETIKPHLTLVHVFHTYASTDTPWVAHALSQYTPVMYGMIAFVSAAHNATQFGDYICLICVSTVQMFVHSDPTNTGLKRHRRGLSPWSSEYQIRLLSFLLIHYSPFSLIALSGLQLCQSFNHLVKPHRTSIDKKSPIVSKF